MVVFCCVSKLEVWSAAQNNACECVCVCACVCMCVFVRYCVTCLVFSETYRTVLRLDALQMNKYILRPLAKNQAK